MDAQTEVRVEETTSSSIRVDNLVLKAIDTRAKALNLNRSQYLVLLALQDLKTLGPLIVDAKPIPTEEEIKAATRRIAHPPPQTPPQAQPESAKTKKSNKPKTSKPKRRAA